MPNVHIMLSFRVEFSTLVSLQMTSVITFKFTGTSQQCSEGTTRQKSVLPLEK